MISIVFYSLEMELTFSCSYELFDGSQVVELKQFGISESVTEENKVEYVELMKEWLIRKRLLLLLSRE